MESHFSQKERDMGHLEFCCQDKVRFLVKKEFGRARSRSKANHSHP